jgi:DNA repair exonuclease SbcCD nuclease subunit
MLIQIYSDIHLEFKTKIIKIKPCAPYLFLTGDIGKFNGLYMEFITYCSKNWIKTFVILGNHEYYNIDSDYNSLKNNYTDFINTFDNVYLLDNNYVELNNEINVYGCTFWTPPTTNITSIINDYKYINMEPNKLIDKEFVSYLSEIELTNLVNYLTNNTKKTIIITHFPPIQENTSNPKFVSSKQFIKDYFAWNNNIIINDYNLNKNIYCWISGHTHYSYDFMKNNIRFISNQFGYSTEVYESKINIEGLYNIDI